MHAAIDGYTRDPTSLTDTKLIECFLDTHPAEIGMTKIAPPQVFTYRGANEEDWGVSGFVLIAESHITIHTFPDRGYVNIDIFSCKAFDVDASLARVKSLFKLDQLDTRVLDRGLEYLAPRPVSAESPPGSTGLVRSPEAPDE